MHYGNECWINWMSIFATMKELSSPLQWHLCCYEDQRFNLSLHHKLRCVFLTTEWVSGICCSACDIFLAASHLRNYCFRSDSFYKWFVWKCLYCKYTNHFFLFNTTNFLNGEIKYHLICLNLCLFFEAYFSKIPQSNLKRQQFVWWHFKPLIMWSLWKKHFWYFWVTPVVSCWALVSSFILSKCLRMDFTTHTFIFY